jgi:hypothetical protein
MRPLPLRQLDLELDEAWASRSRGDAADSRASPAESINSSSSSSSGHESTAEGEHLGFTAWPTEDGGLASFSYSLDLEWPEHLQSALYPRATVPSWKDLNQVYCFFLPRTHGSATLLPSLILDVLLSLSVVVA